MDKGKLILGILLAGSGFGYPILAILSSMNNPEVMWGLAILPFTVSVIIGIIGLGLIGFAFEETRSVPPKEAVN